MPSLLQIRRATAVFLYLRQRSLVVQCAVKSFCKIGAFIMLPFQDVQYSTEIVCNTFSIHELLSCVRHGHGYGYEQASVGVNHFSKSNLNAADSMRDECNQLIWNTKYWNGWYSKCSGRGWIIRMDDGMAHRINGSQTHKQRAEMSMTTYSASKPRTYVSKEKWNVIYEHLFGKIIVCFCWFSHSFDEWKTWTMRC